MDIRSALKKTGMAYHPQHADIVINSNNRVVHFKTGNAIKYQAYDDLWQPHHPDSNCPCGCREERKCVACDDSHRMDESGLLNQCAIASHLRLYHCTCKDKP